VQGVHACVFDVGFVREQERERVQAGREARESNHEKISPPPARPTLPSSAHASHAASARRASAASSRPADSAESLAKSLASSSSRRRPLAA
jgi:hypothetical protein